MGMIGRTDEDIAIQAMVDILVSVMKSYIRFQNFLVKTGQIDNFEDELPEYWMN